MFSAGSISSDIGWDIRKTVSEGRVWSGSILNRRKDGGNFIWEFCVSPYYDKKRKTIAYVAIQLDVSERKKEEQERRAVIQATAEGFLICNTEGKLLEVNDSLCRMIGYNREELKEMSV